MKKYKNNLLSKSNYDIKFEELIENKSYSDETKSLILNIIYRIDSAYNDYKTVKPNVKSKVEIIEEIDNAIDSKCEVIELLNPLASKKKILISKKNKEIRTYPRDVDLLKAIYYMRTPYAKKSANVFEKAVDYVLENGFAINGTEVIRDFNGWSWNNALEDDFEKYCNIMYQNLIILLGEGNVEEIIKSNSIVDYLTNQLVEFYDKALSEGFIANFVKLCVLMYARSSKKNKSEVSDYLAEREQDLHKLADKSKYTSKITDEISKKTELICKIDALLKTPKDLNKKFEKEQKNGKFKDIESFKLYLIKYKNEIQNEITVYRRMMSPFEYLKTKNQYEKEVSYLKELADCWEDKDVILRYILELQKNFINCFYKKIEAYELKKELLTLVYEVRYYNLLPLEKKTVNCFKELKPEIDKMQNELINKLKKSMAVDIFSSFPRINYHIMKRIFETKMIDISKIMVKYKIEGDSIVVIYLDEESTDNEVHIKIKEDEKQGFVKKENKKTKIFI